MRHAFVRLAALAAGATLAGGFLVAAADAPEPEPTTAPFVETTPTPEPVTETAPAVIETEAELSIEPTPADAPDAETIAADVLDTAADVDTVGEAQETETGDVIWEDDPRWDCRTMGNQTCGVVISGTWYLVTFADGEPVAVTPR